MGSWARGRDSRRARIAASPSGLTFVLPVGEAIDVAWARDEEYGGRNATVRDPEGNLWSFGSYRPESG